MTTPATNGDQGVITEVAEFQLSEICEVTQGGSDAEQAPDMESHVVTERRCPRDVCNTLLKNIYRLKPRSRWLQVIYIDWKSFVEAVEVGCPICRIFRDALLCFLPRGPVELEKFPVYAQFEASLGRKGDPRLSRLGLSLYGKSHFGFRRVELYAPDDNKLCRWPLRPVPPSKRDVSFEAKLPIIDSWLQNCRETHTACCSYRGISEGELTLLPRRVLDVCPPNCELRLVETQNEKGRYICLSHCWGSSQPLTSTRSSLEGWKRVIPWDIVPRTFQDAITVTRKLGIRFLWIDSLCIVQDDREDWKDHASSMCAIYQNAFLTIAATRCEGCTDSLFPSFQRTVEGSDENGSPLSVVAVIESTHLSFPPREYPLLTRGWVLQERLLSRRVLHFGYDEIFWECMESTSCECSPRIVGGGLRIKSARYLNPDDATKEYRRDIWHEIVKEYTALEFTYASDRQAAILGLAGEMGHNRQGRYFAGLWEDSLISDLAWRVDSLYNLGTRTEAVPTPTWSWACVERQCKYESKWVDRNTTVLSMHSLSIDKFPDDGQALDCLTLRGRLISGKSNLDHVNLERLDRMRERWELYYEWFGKSFSIGNWANPLFHRDVCQERAISDGESVFCLELGAHSCYECGLVLRLVDFDQQLYARIGIVDVEYTLSSGMIRSIGVPSVFDQAVETIINII